jgi:Rab-GTPase-TBC domain
MGLAPSQRRQAWLDLAVTIGDVKKDETRDDPLQKEALLREKEKREHYFRAALREVFGNLDPLPGKIFRLAFLGVEPAILPEEATVLLSQPSIAVSAAHDRVISVLAQLHSLRYCPQVPNLALILLSYLSESDTFAAMESLLSHNKSIPMLLLSKREETAFIKTFRTLVKSYYPQLSAHLESLGGPVRAIYASWFRGFFTGWLPTEDVHKVVDSYLMEGPKVLIRFGLAFLKILKRKLKATTNAGEIDRVFRRWVARAVVKRALASASASGSAGSATSASSSMLVNIPPHLLSDLSSTSGVADPLVPEEYSFDLLRETAFEGISGLSRSTITKLMEKYSQTTTASAAGASSSSGAGATATGQDPVGGGNSGASAGGSGIHSVTRSRLGSDGDQVMTVPSQNAVLTIGHNGNANPALAAAAAATASTAPTNYLGAHGAAYLESKEARNNPKGNPAGWDVTENGVIYDSIGLDPSAASSAEDNTPSALLGVWSNPKIVGIGTRLMTQDFSPLDASAFIQRINAAHRRLHTGMYCPPALQSTTASTPTTTPLSLHDDHHRGDNAFVTARNNNDGEGGVNTSSTATVVRTAGWIQGLKAHLGLAPDQTIGSLATVASSDAFVPTYGGSGGGGHHGHAAPHNRPTIAEIFGPPPHNSHHDGHAAIGVAEDHTTTTTTTSTSATTTTSTAAGVPKLHLPSATSAAAEAAEAAEASTTTPVVRQAPGTGRLASSSDIVAAFSVASSPHLASLCTLLPSSVGTLNWACLYSTDVHGWSLDSLYTLTSGFAPVMVFIQAQVRTAAAAAGADGSEGAAAAPATTTTTTTTTTSATASKLATAVSSKRPVFGFFASRGLRPAALLQNDQVQGIDSHGNATSRRGSGTGRADGATTYGGRSDFLFQLYPEVSLFPVSNLEPASGGGSDSATTTTSSTGGVSGAFSHADLVGTGHRTLLTRDHFLTCLNDHLCVGGIPGRAGSHALRISRELGSAVASKAFLLDMSVPLPPPSSTASSSSSGNDNFDEVALDVLAIEAYAFLDRQGNFHETRERSAAVEAALQKAKRHYLRNLSRYWETGERELSEQQQQKMAATARAAAASGTSS